jgi:hypothetical protein
MNNATRTRRGLGPYVRPTHQLARRRNWLAARLANHNPCPKCGGATMLTRSGAVMCLMCLHKHKPRRGK